MKFELYIWIICVGPLHGLMHALYPYGEDANDNELDKTDDAVETIGLKITMPVFGHNYDEITIGSNGIVSFGGEYNADENRPVPFTNEDGDDNEIRTLMAWWTDMNSNATEKGQVYYREVTEGTELDKVTSDLTQGLLKSSPLDITESFAALQLVVLTYSEVTHWHGTDMSPANTLQLVIASDGTRTFAMVNFGDIQWTMVSQYAMVGYNVGDNRHYYEYPGSYSADIGHAVDRSNVFESGRWVMQINMQCDPGVCDAEHGVCLEFNKCLCEDGWTGEICDTEILECESSPCLAGTCLELIAGYVCECDPGFTGTRCEFDINECESNPCQYGACVDGEDHYVCNCLAGYKGFQCEQEIDDCESCPCFHGICKDAHLYYDCECEEGFGGINCEIDKNACEGNPCGDNSVCEDTESGLTCHCYPGYVGPDCSVEINECESKPCVHGLCVDGVNRYDCLCDAGYTGTRCDEDIDECISSPCFHGTCLKGTNSFVCVCEDYWYGTQCEINKDHCSSSPCHFGFCHDYIDKYTCECYLGYSGTLCEIELDECKSAPCQLGQCVDVANGYLCLCPPGVNGTHCHDDQRPPFGTVDEWGSWSSCSKTCDRGIRTRYKQCLRAPCLEDNQEVMTCNPRECPANTGEPDELAAVLLTQMTQEQFALDEYMIKKTIASILNSYCSLHMDECCELASALVLSDGSSFHVFTVEDVHILSGYPKIATEDRVIVKILVQAMIQDLYMDCGGGGELSLRVKRQSAQKSIFVYIPPSLLEEALTSGLEQLNSVSCCWFLTVKEDVPLLTILLSTLIPAAVLLIIFIILIARPKYYHEEKVCVQDEPMEFLEPLACDPTTHDSPIFVPEKSYLPYPETVGWDVPPRPVVCMEEPPARPVMYVEEPPYRPLVRAEEPVPQKTMYWQPPPSRPTVWYTGQRRIFPERRGLWESGPNAYWKQPRLLPRLRPKYTGTE